MGGIKMQKLETLTIIFTMLSLCVCEKKIKKEQIQWQTLQNNIQHTGHSYIVGPKSAKFKWQLDLRDNSPSYSTPIIDSFGNIYVCNYRDVLYAINKEGRLLWKFESPKAHEIQIPQIAAPLLLYNRDIIYGTIGGLIYSIDHEGTINWSYDTGSPITIAPTCLSDSLILIGNNIGNLYAFDYHGVIKWKMKINERIVESSPAVSKNRRIVYLGAENKFYAISSSGKIRWHYDTEGTIVSSPLVDLNDNIYFGAGLSTHVSFVKPNGSIGSRTIQDDTSIYSLDNNGKLRWRLQTERPIQLPGAYDPKDNAVYFSSDECVLYKIDCESCNLIWKNKFKNGCPLVPIIDSQQNLYVGTSNGIIYSLNKNGRIQWNCPVEGLPMYLSICKESTIYTGGNSKIYAIH